MSDCCLPNLGCLAIPIISTEVNGPPGPNGTNGVGITTAFYNPVDGTLLLSYSDGSSQNVGVVQGGVGQTGQTGQPGVGRLYSNFVSSSVAVPASGTYTFNTYSVAANELIADGDGLLINLRTSRASATGTCQRKISWNGVSISRPISTEVEMLTTSATYQYNTRIEIIRTSSSTATCNVVSDYDTNANNASGVTHYTFQKSLTGVDFSAVNSITFELSQSLANQAVFKSLTIDKITII
jgi:hypothetical protein